jgi:hypothetical protein
LCALFPSLLLQQDKQVTLVAKMLGEVASYGVYLIHYIFTVVGMALSINMYNHIYDNGIILFYAETTISFSVLQDLADGAIQLIGGFVMCTPFPYKPLCGP